MPNGPLHFTEVSAGPGNGGLIVNSGGTVTLGGDVSVDEGIDIAGGTVVLNQTYTLTSGQVGSSQTVYVSGGIFEIMGTLVAHGGVDMTGGQIETNGKTTGKITMDRADTFSMDGGTLTISQPLGVGKTAVGQLEIAGGNMTIVAGTVEVDCDSTHNQSGKLVVDNTLTISGGTFVTQDLDFNAFGYAFTAITANSESGDFGTYTLPRMASTHTRVAANQLNITT